MPLNYSLLYQIYFIRSNISKSNFSESKRSIQSLQDRFRDEIPLCVVYVFLKDSYSLTTIKKKNIYNLQAKFFTEYIDQLFKQDYKMFSFAFRRSIEILGINEGFLLKLFKFISPPLDQKLIIALSLTRSSHLIVKREGLNHLLNLDFIKEVKDSIAKNTFSSKALHEFLYQMQTFEIFPLNFKMKVISILSPEIAKNRKLHLSLRLFTFDQSLYNFDTNFSNGNILQKIVQERLVKIESENLCLPPLAIANFFRDEQPSLSTFNNLLDHLDLSLEKNIFAVVLLLAKFPISGGYNTLAQKCSANWQNMNWKNMFIKFLDSPSSSNFITISSSDNLKNFFHLLNQIPDGIKLFLDALYNETWKHKNIHLDFIQFVLSFSSELRNISISNYPVIQRLSKFPPDFSAKISKLLAFIEPHYDKFQFLMELIKYGGVISSKEKIEYAMKNDKEMIEKLIQRIPDELFVLLEKMMVDEPKLTNPIYQAFTRIYKNDLEVEKGLQGNSCTLRLRLHLAIILYQNSNFPSFFKWIEERSKCDDNFTIEFTQVLTRNMRYQKIMNKSLLNSKSSKKNDDINIDEEMSVRLNFYMEPTIKKLISIFKSNTSLVKTLAGYKDIIKLHKNESTVLEELKKLYKKKDQEYTITQTNMDATLLNLYKANEDAFDLLLRCIINHEDKQTSAKKDKKEMLHSIAIISSMVNQKLLSHKNNEALLTFIYAALKNSPKSNSFFIAISLLKPLIPTMQKFPLFCRKVVEIHNLGNKIPQTINLLKKIAENNSTAQQESDKSSEKSAFGIALVDAKTIKSKIVLILNNLSDSNIATAAAFFSENLDTVMIQYFADYFVLQKVSIHGNLFNSYLALHRLLDNKDLKVSILNSSYAKAKSVLTLESIVNNSPAIKELRNISRWLGSITIANKKPLLIKHIDLKSQLIRAFNSKSKHRNDFLIASVIFACNILRNCKDVPIFMLPNPWTLSIFQILKELSILNIEMRLCFEIDSLFEFFEISQSEITLTSMVLIGSNIKNAMPGNNNNIPVRTSPAKNYHTINLSSNNITNPSINLPSESVMKNINPILLNNSENANFADLQKRYSAIQQQFPNFDATSSSYVMDSNNLNGRSSLEEDYINGLHKEPFILQFISDYIRQKAVVDTSLSASLRNAHLSSNVIECLVTSIANIFPPIIDRCVFIATIATKELMNKDFSHEPDENVLQEAAMICVKSLAGNLAIASCKEPLRAEMYSNLYNLFQHSMSATESERLAATVSKQNFNTACKIVADTAILQAKKLVYSHISESIELRKKYKQNNLFFPGENYSQEINNAPLYPNSLPFELQPKRGGLTALQKNLYFDLDGILHAHVEALTEWTNTADFLSLCKTGGQSIVQDSEQFLTPFSAATLNNLNHNQISNFEIIRKFRESKLMCEFESLCSALKSYPRGEETLFSSLNEKEVMKRQVDDFLRTIESAPAENEEKKIMHLLLADHVYNELCKRIPNKLFFSVCLGVLKCISGKVPQVRERLSRFYICEKDSIKFNHKLCEQLLLNDLLLVKMIDEHFSKLMDSLKPAPHNRSLFFVGSLINSLVFIHHKIPIGQFPLVCKFHSKVSNGDFNAEQINPTALTFFQFLEEKFQNRESVSGEPKLISPETFFEKWFSARQSTARTSAFVASLSENLFTCAFIRSLYEYALVRERTHYNGLRFLALAQAILCIARDAIVSKANKIPFLKRVFAAVIELVGSDSFQPPLQQKEYREIFSSLMQTLCSSAALVGPQHVQVLVLFLESLSHLNPQNCPRLAFAWLELFSHRAFLPRVLSMRNEYSAKCRFHTVQILCRVFVLLEKENDKSRDERINISGNGSDGERGSDEAIRRLAEGVTRLFLVLLNDFPDFLAEFYFELCTKIPLAFVQMRNVVLLAVSDTPRLEEEFDTAHRLLHKANLREEVDPFFNSAQEISNAAATALFTRIRHKLSVSLPENKKSTDWGATSSLVLYAGSKSPEDRVTKFFGLLFRSLDLKGKYFLAHAMMDHLRFSCTRTSLFFRLLVFCYGESDAQVCEVIFRVLLERLASVGRHPFGLVALFVELVRNPFFNVSLANFAVCCPNTKMLYHTMYDKYVVHNNNNNTNNTNNNGCGGVGGNGSSEFYAMRFSSKSEKRVMTD